MLSHVAETDEEHGASSSVLFVISDELARSQPVTYNVSSLGQLMSTSVPKALNTEANLDEVGRLKIE